MENVKFATGGHRSERCRQRGGDRRLTTRHDRLSFVACRSDAREHELATHREIARALAALLGCSFAGEFDRHAPLPPRGYLVPNDTIACLDCARRFGIRDERDLYGGVVPFPFVATKVITHPLVERGAAAPVGWSDAFPERVRNAVLPGYTAFSRSDALTAARRLLGDGPVRAKLANATGGRGQAVAHDMAAFESWLDTLDAAAIDAAGVVVERNLERATTYSIGRIRVGSLLASYHGTQRTTRDARGQEVYGGSTIQVVRGGFDSLLRLHGLDRGAARAIALAYRYHRAAFDCFAGMIASRSNYDVVEGCDAGGRRLSGVLEQSWRLGGASGAEVAALQALHDDPTLPTVRASTVEEYGEVARVPTGASLHFSGIDSDLGPITKYAQVHRDAHD